MSFFKSLFSTANKERKFESENYVNYISKDNNMKIRLLKEYIRDDVSDYDFYAVYEDKLYFGMYVYNLDEYKGYTENQIINEQFSIMSKSRKMKVIANNQIQKYQDKITNTIVYSSKREEYINTIIVMSTIRFYNIPNYIVYVVQTCSEDDYTIYKEILMKNLANIESNVNENESTLKNKTIDENNNYILPEGGDFNLYLNYTDKVDFNGIQKFFEKYGLNVDVDYEKEEGYTRFSINSKTGKEGITPEFYCYREKYNQYINDMVEDAKADDEYDSKFEKEVNNLKKANSYYMISTHSKQEVNCLLCLAEYLSKQMDFVMIYDCYNGKYLSVNDIMSINKNSFIKKENIVPAKWKNIGIREPQEVIDVINEAYANKEKLDATIYIGASKYGNIGMGLGLDGKIENAFPVKVTKDEFLKIRNEINGLGLGNDLYESVISLFIAIDVYNHKNEIKKIINDDVFEFKSDLFDCYGKNDLLVIDIGEGKVVINKDIIKKYLI